MSSPSPSKDVDSKRVLALLAPEGLLARHMPRFEARPQQKGMLADLLRAFDEKKIALIEAGTGTGKSIAYLLPAIAAAAKKQETVVIATGTINLQEQLLNKDIPTLLKALGIELKVALVKGMNNYLCLRRLENIADDLPYMNAKEQKEVEEISRWSHNSGDGSKSSLSFVPQYNVWESLKAESDACTGVKCPHYEECFFFKARRYAADARLLVVNHHLLFADLALRSEEENYEDTAVLPAYQRVIIDEAHHIEHVATDFFAKRLSRVELAKLLNKLSTERGGHDSGKLSLLKGKVIDRYKRDLEERPRALIAYLTDTLSAGRRRVLEEYRVCFDRIEEHFSASRSKDSDKFRLRKEHYTDSFWQREVIPNVHTLVSSLKHYVVSLIHMERRFIELEDKKLDEMTGDLRAEVKALTGRLDNYATTLALFAEAVDEDRKVRWIEAAQMNTLTNFHLFDVDLDISQHLVDHLFSRFSTVAMCSATLTNYDGFQFFRKRMGLVQEKFPDNRVIENHYDSPFDYPRQAMLVVPTDMPQPQEPHFTAAAIERIEKIVKVSRGGVFILFTSYSMLQQCYDALCEPLSQLGFPLFKQGDLPRRQLIQEFKEKSNSVLFGTSSFWEGVDVAGDALRCVIIVKLPFQVPSEPVVQARTERISRLGGDPFMGLSIPSTIVKFKQGFGRLIRKHDDRGCIVCLDVRLINRSYGKLFLNSLPPCKQLLTSTEIALKQMEEFYKKGTGTKGTAI